MAFVHLHLHTEYSLLDGCNRIKALDKKAPSPLVARVKELGQTAVAMTDHGVMGGMIEFYHACKKEGIKPLVGCEVYVAQRTRFDKEAHKDARPFHLTLIAKNRRGYANLCRLVSLAYIEGFYYRPRVDHELLQKYGEGLICLSGCLRGEVNDALLNDNYELAKERLAFLKSVFKDDLFVELMNHGIPEQHKTNPLLLRLAHELDIIPVATNDAHYLTKDDAHLHDTVVCISTGKTLDDPKRLKMSTEELYVKSEEEMLAAFDFYPQAVTNTQLVADRVEDFSYDKDENGNKVLGVIDFDSVYLPKFQTVDGTSSEDYLRQLCAQGIVERYGGNGLDKFDEVHVARLQSELDVIIGKGFADYFLLVWDFINWARVHGIPVGPGRGSAAGSLVAYLIGITQLDPIPYDLLFERFLNPERTELPDIDTDFCTEGRGAVIDYCREKYGHDRVAQIATYGRMLTKNAIKDVARVMGLPIADADRLTKALPNDSKMTMAKALEIPDFRALYEKDPRYKEVIDNAMRCEGMLRNSGIHACGVIISSEDLKSLVPLQRGPKGETVVQYDGPNSAEVGMVKMDFLALRNLTVIEYCLKNIEHSHGQRLDLAALTKGFDDQQVYKLLSAADTTGVFQLESAGMKRYLKQLQPDRFTDIVAFLALYRPGPINGGVVDRFIDARHGRGGGVKYPHPKLEHILKDTYGFFIYQEQVMLTACVLSGYNMAKADKLRKAMGKKKMDVMAANRPIFADGAVERGVERQTALDIFTTMEKFAEYGFNKSHSAAYALVSYYTAYLKCYYRAEYMAALLTSVMTDIAKVSFFVEECRETGVQVKGPDINESLPQFTVVDGVVLWGMAAVRNVGSAGLGAIVAEREKGGKFTSLLNFAQRVDFKQANRKVMEGLIKSGALDQFGYNRCTLMVNLENIMEYGTAYRRDLESDQLDLFADMAPDSSVTDGDERTLIKTVKEEYQRRTFLDFEKEMLGIYLSGSPLDAYLKQFKSDCIVSFDKLSDHSVGDRITLGGIVNSVRKIVTKRSKENMAFVILEGVAGKVELTIMPNAYRTCGDLFEEGVVLEVTGVLELSRDSAPVRNDNSGDDDDEDADVVVEEQEKKYQLLVEKASSPVLVDSMAGHKRYAGLNVRVRMEQYDLLPKLRSVIEREKGTTPIYIHLTDGHTDKTILLGDTFKCSASETQQRSIAELVGQGSCWVE